MITNKGTFTKIKKSPPLIDHHVVRTYILFSDKLAKPHLPPKMFVVHNFLYWMAFNLGYSSTTIKKYKFILQDYFEENGFYLTDQTRLDLGKAVLNIKREHAIKNQDEGKPPMLYKDLKKILSCVPNSYKRKNLMNSLFLCANFTAQRASSMTSVKFDDINVTKNARGKDCIRIKFNVVKGKGKQAGIKKILLSMKEMKVCVSFKSYVQSEYGINIKDFNSIRTSEKFKDKKFSNISRHYFRWLVYQAFELAGYPKRFFSPHSIRAGVVCDMLLKAITSNTHLFASVFEQAKILGNWVTRSKAFSRYINSQCWVH